MRNLETLARDLDKLRVTKNADFFYRVMGDLMEGLGFSFYYDTMGVSFKAPVNDRDLARGIFGLYGKEEIEALNSFIKDSKIPVEAFIRIKKFIRGQDYFEMFTSYEDFDKFKSDVYDVRVISSSSKFHFSKEVFDFEEIHKHYPEVHKGDLFDWMIEICGVIKRGETYYFSPHAVFELVDSAPKVFYVGFEVK